MPALFAYLIAVGLLVGGGYRALSWLAAPEPAKVVARAKPKLLPHYAASETSSATSPAINDSDKDVAISHGDTAAAASNDRPPSSASQVSVATSGRGAQGQVSRPTPDQRTSSANAAVSSEEVKRYAKVSPAEAEQEAKQEGRPAGQTVAAIS